MLAAAPLHAQTAVLADSVVVTATRSPDDLRRTGRAVTVVTADDIARSPASSLDELLRTAAGVEVMARGPLGTQADLAIRGSTFGGLLLVIDGVRADDPQTGHFLSDFPIPLAEIARIEVLRGPAAALYGPDAVGGVVQILTKTALGVPVGQATAQLGSYGLQASELAAAMPFGPAVFGLAASSLRTDGEPVESLDGGTMGDRARLDVDRRAFAGAVRFRTRRGVFVFRAAQDDRAYGSVRHYSASRLDTAFSTATTTFGHLSFRGEVSPRLSVEASAGLRLHESTYTFNPVTPSNIHDNRQINAQAVVHRIVSPRLSLDAGLSASRRSIESTNMGDHAAASAGAFGQLRYAAGPLAASFAARVDADPDGFGTEITPQASASYTAGRLTLRGAGGRAVRAPSFTDLYYNTQVANIRGRDVGNPNLKAERAWSAEAGADFEAAPGLTLRLTGFGRKTDNLIDFVKTSAADTVFRAQNLLAVTVRGVEAEASYRKGGAAASLAYTVLDLTRDASGVVASKYALQNARHLVQANVAYTVEAGAAQGLTVGASGFWRDPYPNPPAAPGVVNPRTDAPYAVVNFRAAYPLPVPRLRLAATVDVRNAFDTRYVELFAPVMGRWWLVGLRMGE